MAPVTRATTKEIAERAGRPRAHFLCGPWQQPPRQAPAPRRGSVWYNYDADRKEEKKKEDLMWGKGKEKERRKKMRKERMGGLGAERRRRVFGGGKGKGKRAERLRDERGRWMKRERV